jgi:dihydrofolate reductase
MTGPLQTKAEASITLVVAAARNGVIGKDGGLPWRLSSDLKRFKANTIGRPLPGRDNIVVTRDRSFAPEGVFTAPDIDAAIEMGRARARQAGAAEICVIGGGEVYRQTFDLAERLAVTYVEAEIEGDTIFPAIDSKVWEEVSSESHPAGEKDSHATRHVVYERRV